MLRVFTDVFSTERGWQILATASVIGLLANLVFGWNFAAVVLIVMAVMVLNALAVFVFTVMSLKRIAHKYGFSDMNALILALDTVANTIFNDRPAKDNTSGVRATEFLRLADDKHFVEMINNAYKRKAA